MSASIKQLREFIAVAEARSITRAAQALFVAQPALSLQIRRLETDLGIALFTRLPRGVELTEEGASCWSWRAARCARSTPSIAARASCASRSPTSSRSASRRTAPPT
jgi:hypothetical protein